MARLKYLLWLATRQQLQPRQAVALAEHFGTAEAAYFADPSEYDLLQIGGGLRASLGDKDLTGTDRILGDCDRLGVRLLTYRDADYPERLLQLPDYPLVLYVQGRRFDFDEELAIGMVGARRCTPYGEAMAGRIGLELARGGALVISGIAQGIDAAALRGALQGGGPVVSVLGCGTDVVYPRENRWLYQDVAAAGALVSEYPPGTRPLGAHFPVRNRILSGLCAGVVAVEAQERSGTLITARLALEQDREVFAVPGPADAPTSAGTNALISRGEAKLVRNARDILVEFEGRFPHKLRPAAPLDAAQAAARLSVATGPPQPPGPAPKPERPAIGADTLAALADQEREILLLLGQGALTADELVGRLELPARRVNTALTILQTQGLITELPGRRFEAAVRCDI